jgi:hypothetical protein
MQWLSLHALVVGAEVLVEGRSNLAPTAKHLLGAVKSVNHIVLADPKR